MHHELKILPCYFEAVKSGDKTFEIRRNNDRGFQKGDTLTLVEHDGRAYGDEQIAATITYVTNYAQKEDYVVFGIKVDAVG